MVGKHELFVGGIVSTASLTEIEDEFKKFGKCNCLFPVKVSSEYHDMAGCCCNGAMA